MVSTGALAWTRGRALAGLAAGPASRLPVRRCQRVCPDAPTECSRATRVQGLGVEADQRGRPSRAWRDVLLRTTVECWRIEDGHHTEKKLQALIKIEVACRLALESLPELPRDPTGSSGTNRKAL